MYFKIFENKEISKLEVLKKNKLKVSLPLKRLCRWLLFYYAHDYVNNNNVNEMKVCFKILIRVPYKFKI